jgi:hypothetical protein
VLLRFVLRLVLVGAISALSNKGFATTVSALLTMTAIFCATLAAMRREPVFGRVLTHWDEAAAYALIGRGIVAFS